jgi:hypothetical protein
VKQIAGFVPLNSNPDNNLSSKSKKNGSRVLAIDLTVFHIELMEKQLKRIQNER